MIHVTCQMWGSLTRSGHQHRAKAELTCTTLQRLVRFPWVPYRSLPMKMRPEESIRFWLVVQSTSITIHDKDVSQVMIRCCVYAGRLSRQPTWYDLIFLTQPQHLFAYHYVIWAWKDTRNPILSSEARSETKRTNNRKRNQDIFTRENMKGKQEKDIIPNALW
jgi:hypothetical protein